MTEQALDAYFTDLVRRRPQPMSADDRATAHECVAVCFHTGDEAAFMRLVASEGTTVDLKLNPAMVQVLREALLVCGLDAGWMDEDGALNVRQPPAAALRRLKVA